MNRPTHSTEYLRHNLTDREMLALGDELVAAQTSLIELKEEKAVVNAQIADKQKVAEQTVGRLTRLMASKFEMRNVRCVLKWDFPNINEVSTIREDNGELVKTRPFSEAERQQELPLPFTNREGEIAVIPPPPEKTEAEAQQVIEESQANVDGYFANVTCHECEKPFPASVVVKTTEGRDLCPECYAKQPADVQPEGAVPAAVEIPVDADSSGNGVSDEPTQMDF